MGFIRISLGAHSNPISFLWDSHRYPWAHTATRSLFWGGFTQISLGPDSNPISLFFFFFFFFWDSHRYPWAHRATRSLFFGIHTDIPRRTPQPDLFSLGFTQISLGAHSNPISLFFFLFFFFFGIHTDIPGRTQQHDLSFFFLSFFFFLGFTQISLGAHSNPISLFFFLFFWDSHRYPWAHTATQYLSFFFSFFFFWDSHRCPWAHTATRSLFFGIHTDIPGRTQQPDLFSLGFTQISLGAHSNPISLFFFFSCFLGFTQISLGAHSNPISFLWDSHRYPWAHTATQSLLVGIHTDIPGRTQQPDLFSLGFTQISLGAHSNPISLSLFFFFLFFGIHTDIPGRTQQPDLFSLGFTQISLGAHSNPISSRWDSHRFPWAHTATRSLLVGIHTDIYGRTQQPDLFSLGSTQISMGAHSNPISSRWDSHRFPRGEKTATRALLVGIHTDIPGRTQQPELFSLGFTQISLGAHSNPNSSRWDSHKYLWVTQKPYHKKAHQPE